jgi:PadR family transcriptional regulator PadR
MNEKILSRWEAQVKKGILDFILLLLLREKEQYGYELIQQIHSRVGYEIAEGTIYPLLIRLKEDHLVEAYWQEKAGNDTGMPRKYYRITPQGIQTLRDMTVYWTELSTNLQKLLIH